MCYFKIINCIFFVFSVNFFVNKRLIKLVGTLFEMLIVIRSDILLCISKTYKDQAMRRFEFYVYLFGNDK